MGVTLTPDTFTNFASSTLAGGAGGVSTPLNSTDLTIHVAAGTGSLFPSTYPFRLIINPNSLSAAEVAIATASAGTDAFTITRHAEGTSSPAAWQVGTSVIHGGTAANWSNIWTALSQINLTNGGTVSGTLTITSGGVVATGASTFSGGTLTLPGSATVDTLGNLTTSGLLTAAGATITNGGNGLALQTSGVGVGLFAWNSGLPGLAVQSRQSGSANGIYFNVWTGSATATAFSIGNSVGAANVDASGNIASAGHIHSTSELQAGNGWVQSGSTNLILDATGNGFIGFKSGGTDIAEMNGGSFYITGTYNTTGPLGSIFTGSGFPNPPGPFDYGEIYAADAVYTYGDILCPADDGSGLLSRCIHDACAGALIVSNPGFCIGRPNHEERMVACALVGRYDLPTAQAVHPRDLLVTNGQGGVRVLGPGEAGHILGVALSGAQNGWVRILVRPMYVSAR